MNSMKKFVGNVNGTEFTNVDEFTKAVNDAIASGESPMMISSYYKDCDCGKNECEECKCSCKKQIDDKIQSTEKTPLNLDSILLTRESTKCGDVYRVPSNAKELLDNASNIEEIKKSIEERIRANNSIIRNDNLQIGNLNKKIEEYNKRIANYNNEKDEANSQISYYNSLKEIIDSNTDDVKVEEKKENEKFIASDSLKKDKTAYNLISDIVDDFDKFLSDVGFWK